MNIEVLDKCKVLITVEWREMAQYGVEFRSMSLHDSSTRAMLHDMLHTIEEMGLRNGGDRVSIECAPSDSGGCVLIFMLAPGSRTRFVFDCCDDLIAAALANVLPENYRISTENDSFILTAARPMELSRERMIMEFCSE